MVKKITKNKNYKRSIRKTKKNMIGGNLTHLDIAKQWEGYGNYVLDSPELIIENENKLEGYYDEYIPNDFIIRFANYGQFQIDKKILDFLFEYSDKRYKDKTISMNCWQFILICLLQSYMIDEDDIKNLYKNYDSNKLSTKRIPDYFGKKYREDKDIKKGDIILFQNIFNEIWHVGILVNKEDTNITYIDMFSTKVHINKNISISNIEDTLLFLEPEVLADNIKKIQKIEYKEKMYVEPRQLYTFKVLLKRFLVYYFRDDISKLANEELNKEIMKDGFDYEKAYSNLKPDGYNNIQKSINSGINIGISYYNNLNDFYKEVYTSEFLKKEEFENKILEEKGLLKFVIEI